MPSIVIACVLFAWGAIYGQVSATTFAELHSCLDGAHSTCQSQCIITAFTSDRQAAATACFTANPMSLPPFITDLETCLRGQGVTNCIKMKMGHHGNGHGHGHGGHGRMRRSASSEEAPASVRSFFACERNCTRSYNCDATCVDPASDSTVKQAMDACRPTTPPPTSTPSPNGLKDCLNKLA